jgi:hypothetical protein
MNNLCVEVSYLSATMEQQAYDTSLVALTEQLVLWSLYTQSLQQEIDMEIKQLIGSNNTHPLEQDYLQPYPDSSAYYDGFGSDLISQVFNSVDQSDEILVQSNDEVRFTFRQQSNGLCPSLQLNTMH